MLRCSDERFASAPYASSVAFQKLKSGEVFVLAQSFLPYGSSSIMRVREVRKCTRKSLKAMAAAQKSRASATLGSITTADLTTSVQATLQVGAISKSAVCSGSLADETRMMQKLHARRIEVVFLLRFFFRVVATASPRRR